LNESQRAMVGAKIANMEHGQKKADTEISVSQADAAGKLNVSADSIGFAKKVQSKGAPELNEAVESGSVAVSTAST